MPCAIHLLGGAAIVGAHGPLSGAAAQRHRLALLALLAVAHPRAVTRDRLCALLWPSRTERRGRALLSLALHELRRALGAGAIVSAGDSVGLDAAAVSVDLHAFEAAWARGNAERAVSAYGGPFLDGFHLPSAPDFDRWADGERTRLASLLARALARAARDRAAAGDRAGAADLWRRLGAHDPYGSANAVRVMKALASLGDRAGALAHAERHAQLLRDEFDAEPGQAVVALVRRLRQPPAIVRGVARAKGDVELADALCLRGRHLWAQRTPGQLRRAIAYFEQALAVVPTHAAAHAGIADAWSVLGFYSHVAPQASFGRAAEAARQALALDRQSSDGSASLAYVRMYHAWDWPLAERGFRRAIRNDPRNPKAHQWLGNLLVLLGRGEEAIERMARVRALQPLSPVASGVRGWACLHAGRLDEARACLDEAHELDPNLAVAWLWRGQLEVASGRGAEALAAFERARVLQGDGLALQLATAQAEAMAGARENAAERIDRVRAERGRGAYVPAYDLAKAELALGRRQRAAEELRRAFAERDHGLAFLRVDPGLAEMREDGVVRDLASRMGL